MVKVISKSGVKLAYGGANRRNLAGPREPANIVVTVAPKVTLAPGDNDVPPAVLAKLNEDPVFQRHVKDGHIVVVADEVTPAAPAEDPRAKKPGEKPAAYAARMKALDEAEASAENDANFLTAWDAMAPDDQEAMRPTLTERETELLANRPAN